MGHQTRPQAVTYPRNLLEFRAELYKGIGAVTVAGGHAEAAMKCVILSAESKGEAFKDVDLNWTGLVKRLQRIAHGEHTSAAQLQSTLSWADRSKIKARRDNVVHAYWWHWAGVGVSRSRFNRDGSSFIVSGTLADLSKLDRDAAMIFEFARRLDDLGVSSWPQARFPAEGSDQGGLSAFHRPVGGTTDPQDDGARGDDQRAQT